MGIPCVLRLVFTLCLFICFLLYFALPSLEKYLDAGIIVEKSWRKLRVTDSPSITLCALDRATGKGWKLSEFEWREIGKTGLDLFCGDASVIKEMEDCIENGTFSLEETISSDNYLKDYEIIKSTNKYWTQDVTDALQGMSDTQ